MIAMCLGASLVSSFSYADALYLRALKPILDERGRVQVIIDFRVDAHQGYPGALPPPPTDKSVQESETKFFHQAKVVSLIADYEKRYGFIRTGMTSWVGSSVTAFLTLRQIDEIISDKMVMRVSDVELSTFSGAPPWQNFNPGNATFSWGSMAVVPHSKLAGSSRRVYVLDGGVASHNNLSSVSSRKNVACGGNYPSSSATGDCDSISFPDYNYPSVGCYGHATHVAGIIAGAGVQGATYGVYSGVNIISVGLLVAKQQYVYGPASPQGLSPPFGNSVGWCGTTAPSADTLGYGLDYTYWDTAYNGGGKVSIANISINPGKMGWTYYPYTDSWQSEVNYSKVRALATPGAFQNSSGGWSSYPGVFVVQSAGNQRNNACGVGNGSSGSLAYMPATGYVPGGAPPNWAADSYDGIMVVGALNSAGQSATSFSDSYPLGLQDGGTNFGPCVDIWAPGNSIVSSWGDHVIWNPAVVSTSTAPPNTRVSQYYSGTVLQGSSGWFYLSGTSMAAPMLPERRLIWQTLTHWRRPPPSRRRFDHVCSSSMVQLIKAVIQSTSFNRSDGCALVPFCERC